MLFTIAIIVGILLVVWKDFTPNEMWFVILALAYIGDKLSDIVENLHDIFKVQWIELYGGVYLRKKQKIEVEDLKDDDSDEL